MIADLNDQAHALRARPLAVGPYTFMTGDALGGRSVNIAVIVATCVNNDRHREILGVERSAS